MVNRLQTFIMASKGKPNGLNKPESQAPGLHIKSYIRVRPLHMGEKRSPNLELTKREISIKSSQDPKMPKVFTFDRVFEEDAKQVTVYSTVVKPMISEVIQGYNCTVFAYGQTGTGKTFTMSGNQGSSGEDNMNAGIIPRALDDIFNELSAKCFEYQVSVVFLELYNEKLKNLLSDVNDDETEIKIIGDAEGGVIMKGVSPTVVKNKDEAFKLLQKGSERKQMAATLLNQNSSRSHTIVTIGVNIKESGLDKDDILRVGKLHLVDLAGSENVSKSGALQESRSQMEMGYFSGVNRRLAEAANINRSLLTLGRVITSITENNPHIPYRESKLTRILRDSLGGKTKTCIIGTIAPSHATLDETESTIGYAWKARSIKNKPEKNQTISKKEFMQVASDEILKLKRDLEAVRQGEGFYISNETHEDMIKNMQTLEVQVKQWNERYNVIDTKYEQLKEQFLSMSEDFELKCSECDELDKLFQLEREKVQKAFEEKKKEMIVREYLIDQYKKTEKNLTNQAKQCKSVLENILDQNKKLHGKIDAQKENETMNTGNLEHLKTDVEDKLDRVEKVFKRMIKQEAHFFKNINHSAANLCDSTNSGFGEIKSLIEEFRTESSEKYKETLNSTEEMKKTLDNAMGGAVETEKGILLHFTNTLDKVYNSFQDMLKTVKDKIDAAITESSKIQQDLNLALIELKPEDNLEYLQRMLKSISVDILEVLSGLESKMNLAVERSNQSKLSCEDVYKKITRISDDVKELQIAMKGSCDQAGESHDNIERLNSHFSKSKQDIETFVHQQDCITESTANVVKEKLAEFGKIHDVEHQEEMQQLESVKAEVINLECGFHCNTNNLYQSLRTEMENCDQRLKSAFDQEYVLEKFKNNADHLHGHTQCYWEHNKDKVKNLEENFEERLRHVLSDVSSNSKVSGENQTKGLQRVSEVKDVIRDMKYTPTSQQGTTPKKVMSEELNYPKEFDATAPLEVLLEKFNNQLKQQSSSTTVLNQQNGSSESIETSRPRRSSSLPDLTKDDQELENKENMGSQDLILSTTKKHTTSLLKRTPLQTSNTHHILRESNTSFK